MRVLLLTLLLLSSVCHAQTNSYHISFPNAVHHEARIRVEFPQLEGDTLVIRMARSSPGRYALHEFAKNIYGLEARGEKGKPLEVIRKDPYSWSITGYENSVEIEYTLFGNRGDGTYTQIDPTHAHLNIPATFMYAEELQDRPVEVIFDTSAHPEWKIATQLKQIGDQQYFAPDLYYFMDSPVEIADFDSRQFEVDGQEIRFILHHPGTPQEFDAYFENVKNIVLQEKAVFGELPDFDYGTYTFLACYMPNVSGDGMEHRNSTVLTDVQSLGEGGHKSNIGTVSHEFFHAWNVERIRPLSLEPFDFSKANMSGALWFAEGFTSYYTNLILARAGIITPEEYVEGLTGTFNYVWNSPALQYFNPIEMSYQAPFVDAATSVDPVNRVNTFVSYYSYGSMLGLALDLKLREHGLSLDGFMRKVWEVHGDPEIPYTIEELEALLGVYAGKDIAEQFFRKHIYDSKMPDYDDLFEEVGVVMRRKTDVAYLGAPVRELEGKFLIIGPVPRNTPAYSAGLASGDRIKSISGVVLSQEESLESVLEKLEPGQAVKVEILRYGQELTLDVVLATNPAYEISLSPEASSEELAARKKWLSAK